VIAICETQLWVLWVSSNHFFNWYSEGWSQIGSTRHYGHQWPIVPAPGDYDDGEIGKMIDRGTEVLGENLPQKRSAHHKPHMLPGREPGPPRWEASNQPLELRHGLGCPANPIINPKPIVTRMCESVLASSFTERGFYSVSSRLWECSCSNQQVVDLW
jgi:hypothetical protein